MPLAGSMSRLDGRRLSLHRAGDTQEMPTSLLVHTACQPEGPAEVFYKILLKKPLWSRNSADSPLKALNEGLDSPEGGRKTSIQRGSMAHQQAKAGPSHHPTQRQRERSTHIQVTQHFPATSEVDICFKLKQSLHQFETASDECKKPVPL